MQNFAACCAAANNAHALRNHAQAPTKQGCAPARPARRQPGCARRPARRARAAARRRSRSWAPAGPRPPPGAEGRPPGPPALPCGAPRAAATPAGPPPGAQPANTAGWVSHARQEVGCKRPTSATVHAPVEHAIHTCIRSRHAYSLYNTIATIKLLQQQHGTQLPTQTAIKKAWTLPALAHLGRNLVRLRLQLSADVLCRWEQHLLIELLRLEHRLRTFSPFFRPPRIPLALFTSRLRGSNHAVARALITVQRCEGTIRYLNAV